MHGAGRLFGRKQAKRTFKREQMDAWLRERGVLLAGGDLDESPMARRRLPEVLAQHAGTIRVLHTLRPFVVAVAGDGEFDPFKDQGLSIKRRKTEISVETFAVVYRMARLEEDAARKNYGFLNPHPRAFRNCSAFRPKIGR